MGDPEEAQNNELGKEPSESVDQERGATALEESLGPSDESSSRVDPAATEVASDSAVTGDAIKEGLVTAEEVDDFVRVPAGEPAMPEGASAEVAALEPAQADAAEAAQPTPVTATEEGDIPEEPAAEEPAYAAPIADLELADSSVGAAAEFPAPVIEPASHAVASDLAEEASGELPPEALPGIEGKPAPVLARGEKLPVREYLDSTVVPVLREGLRKLCKERPEDPCTFLGDFIKAHPTRQPPA